MNEANKKTPRTFQCRNGLWFTYEDMAKELECSVDYLINDAMKQYARQRGYAPDLPSSGMSMPPQSSPMNVAPVPPAVVIAPAMATPAVGAPGLLATSPIASRAPALPSPSANRASSLVPPSPAPALPPAIPPGASRAPASGPTPGSGLFPHPLPPPPRTSGSGSFPHPGLPAAAPAARAGTNLSPPPAPPPLPPQNHGVPPGLPQRAAMAGAAPATLTLTLHFEGNAYPVTKDRFIIGRGKTSSDLTIRDPNISRQHAIVEFSGGTYFIVDMGSTNGIEFRGQRVQRKAIQNGDVFRICDHEVFCSMG